jgi:transcriptional regulator with GAF, ATPase, and Fis domain/CHASE2 domain-containing sensor protein
MKDFTNSVNMSMENIYTVIKGESQPDTNIILITIDANDISRIGPWPIKRSYYALLVKSFSELGVKKIGLEIFLSTRLESQAIYDNLLTKEIDKTGNVVLSSVAGEIEFKDNSFQTDSLSFPTPELLNNKIPTGHLNFIDNNGIYIPLTIRAFGHVEKAFCYQLYNKNKNINKYNELKLNFVSSWKRFKHYSMLEFYKLFRENNPSLASFKSKIVIIGVTDQQIASTIETPFDDFMPGVALHAFALDNLEYNRSLNFSFINDSIIFSLIIFLAIALFVKDERKQLKINSLVFLIFLISSYLLLTFFYVEVSYAFFVFPFIILFAIQSFNLYFQREAELVGSLNETEVLKNLLNRKEIELTHLQKELNVGNKASSEIILNKIKSLKSDIAKLKDKEDDKVESENLITSETKNFHGIVYKSKIIDKVISLINKVAPENATVLILGESGTGKELTAKAIHALSKRNAANFVAVNCGALSDNLLESELFGHIKGAFTGAVADKIGRFEAADKGTIFLDEIAETSENFQVKLLRIIQSGDFEKVGSSKTSHVDVRIIAATNKNLEMQVKGKKFREDLFYRLNVFKIELPPLRERKEDIEFLAHHFLNNNEIKLKISKAAVDALNSYEWKGNVRELEAVTKRAVIFAKSANREIIQLVDLPDEIVKNIKLNFEDVVMESLRNKKFSHSSINETTSEIGNISRTVISENFRGYAFKIYVESNFDIESTVKIISTEESQEVNERVKAKLQTFLRNIERDIKSLDNKGFDFVKIKLNSKYKNLPQKFHIYLDEVIRKFLEGN